MEDIQILWSLIIHDDDWGATEWKDDYRWGARIQASM
ncbi:unnamed protein product [Acanthoscelides obtectus]|uniref:Uncharacterized protein n=1 Tax=Acanthoscelides obtectus TaxID=200917 RepID=A0A9P0PI75_ACAOB|nr:unnamed protein product [Acanthoscelides obtectus]CAK1650854.1 hypothetical protein AOBTE_LOCUS16932 [Acanthoscelides obtectus]